MEFDNSVIGPIRSLCFTSFPLTPALSLGERVKPSPWGEQSTLVALPERLARCSLSPGERVRVRGNETAVPCTSRISSPGRATITD